jgi:serine/threonine protein kinase
MRLEENMLVDGRYRLISRLGSGGMADVWLAQDTQLGRNVALKVLHDRFAQDHQFVERFRREASSAAGLQHPNVVGIFDRGEVDGTYYIAMQYMEGASLKELIERGLTIPQAVAIVRQVLEAAQFAHDNGIVHRDLKPLNVLVNAQGRATVTDFGIARAGHSEITQTGSVMGTAQYLSPEQAQGLEVGPASDIYSIGVMLYEALTGRVPFEADSAVAVALKQISEQPLPPSSLNPQVSPALDSVVLKALVKDPNGRFSSATEFQRALDEAELAPGAPLESQQPAASVMPPEESGGWSRRRWIVLAVLGLLIGGLAAFLLTRPSQVTVPDVVQPGTSVQEASTILDSAGLNVEQQGVPNANTPGQVIETNPPAGSVVDEGSTVQVIFSEGPGQARVPDVNGKPVKQASAELKRAGFAFKTTEQFSDSVDPGVVIRTDPVAGTLIDRGQVVTMLVSRGADTVQVPDVIGQSQGSAEAELRQAGFFPDISTSPSDSPEGTVFQQQPVAGTLAGRHSTVTIVISQGPGTVSVPDVSGEDQQQAESDLRAAGLSVSVEQQDTQDEAEDGVVLDQFPGGGTSAKPGDVVTIRVGHFVKQEPQPVPPGTSSTTTPIG